MNTQTHKNPVLLLVAMLAMTTLISSACSFSNVQVYTPSPVVVDVTHYEDQFNDLSMNDSVRITDDYTVHFTEPYGVHFHKNDGIHLTDHCQPVLDRATRVELHDGYIRFVGTKLQPDGSEVEGSLDLSLTSENGQLKAEIFAVDIPGIDLNNRCVTESNDEREYAFTHMLDYTPGDYNSLYAFRVNRIGTEGTMTFYGKSFCLDPNGDYVTEPAGAIEGVVLADLDLDRIKLTRDDWSFFKDRRPEIYKAVAEA